MKSTIRTIFVLLLMAGWGLAGLSLHVVRFPSENFPGLGIVPKNRLGITDTYVDVRAWTPADLAGHEDLIRRLIATEKTHWLGHLFDTKEGPIDMQLADVLANGAASSQPSVLTKPEKLGKSKPKYTPATRNLGIK